MPSVDNSDGRGRICLNPTSLSWPNISRGAVKTPSSGESWARRETSYSAVSRIGGKSLRRNSKYQTRFHSRFCAGIEIHGHRGLETCAAVERNVKVAATKAHTSTAGRELSQAGGTHRAPADVLIPLTFAVMPAAFA